MFGILRIGLCGLECWVSLTKECWVHIQQDSLPLFSLSSQHMLENDQDIQTGHEKYSFIWAVFLKELKNTRLNVEIIRHLLKAGLTVIKTKALFSQTSTGSLSKDFCALRHRNMISHSHTAIQHVIG